MDQSDQDDNSRPDTPQAIPIPVADVAAPGSASGSPPVNPPSTFHLPIPAPVLSKPQASFTLHDIINDHDENDPLPSEIASADISIATDGSFVETSSGPAARELKRRYDQQYGVGLNVRSPYAITAFVNQHGKQMYRVGHRDLTAPGAAAAEIEERLSSSDSLQAPRPKRRSRMSVHTFIPPTVLKLAGATQPPRPHTSSGRKLRKTRSIPDMYGAQKARTGFRYSLHILLDQRKPPSYLPTPRLLREMQSFESVMTARQMDGRTMTTDDEPKSPETPEEKRPPSAIRIRPSLPSLDISSEFTPSFGTRYSTDVFDVLQTYRGLPLLDKLLPESEEGPVIKMSLSSDDTAAPRDDPRFVIWGEVQVENDGDDVSVSQGSYTDISVSARSSTISRKRSIIKGKAPEIRKPRPGSTTKILVAATIERWIAQLTSDLNYDELLDFFMTYRTYINAVDLCHLLICRFHWALAQPSSPTDERVRRIVRVRTFVAIRYWLLTFFVVDFTPNRELRLLVANWLNTLVRDPTLQQHSDGLSIVRKLRRVAKDCKKANTRTNHAPSSQPRPPKPEATKPEHVLGEKFAEATRQLRPEDEDSDVDLDFLDDAIPDVADTADAPGIQNSDSSDGVSSSRPTSIPLSSLHILQQTKRAPGPGPEPDGPFVQTPATLPIHHSALSRVIVKTIGRLGRWKRVLNSRATVRAPLGVCGDVSAFDLELTASRDLLTVNGGVEQYLKMIEPGPRQPPVITSPENTPVADSQENTPVVESQPEAAPDPGAPSSPPSYEASVSISSPVDQDEPEEEPKSPPGLDVETEESGATQVPVAPVERSPSPQPSTSELDSAPSERALSFRTSSTDSFGSPLAPGASTFTSGPTPWGFDVVSIDDLDLSDTSDDEHAGDASAHPGIRQPARRLPLRRDFEFVRRDTVSSISVMTRDSVASISSDTSGRGDHVLGGGIQQWQLHALIDSLSVDEGGDVDDALQRLEGQINPKKRKEKAMKVDGWIRAIQERMAAGDYEDEPPRFLSDEEDDDEETSSLRAGDIRLQGYGDRLSIPPSSPEGLESTRSISPMDMATTPMAKQHTIPPRPVTMASMDYSLESHSHSHSHSSTLDDVVPLEIQQSRLSLSSSPQYSNQYVNPNAPRIHQSFVLLQRAEALAEHFAMIDRELFLGLRFEELVLDDWKSSEGVNILDWAQYLKDRARWKAEGRNAEKTTALAAIRGRFNLVANFVISEIILTRPEARPLLFSKFIRIAIKSYELSSFHTLVAIMAGLENPWTQMAMKRSWSRVGMYELRIYEDLKVWTTPDDDFKYMRNTIESIADNKPADTSTHAASVTSGGGTNRSKAGSESKPVPTAKLPDLIDPTAPNEAVGIDLVTGNFETPAHPEVFSSLAPLPPSMHLEPLINVHKQRKIAKVIKSLVAGQHLASRVQFQVDKKLLQRCLKLIALDENTLQRAYAMYDS
ncbi:hypothetical protein PLEOSDRAFT_1086297 [Pleurotus ostreatus PC15]|uniref:Ras GEF n=1 Tax=Pleurotus ostreatus (strain PC15) TaxID=1137138 RepID=A0A067N7C6_PLEO1|nr:hypothetical protein PLEOSDRAFT_1086297 [Pleurotus ostreatus PC15]